MTKRHNINTIQREQVYHNLTILNMSPEVIHNCVFQGREDLIKLSYLKRMCSRIKKHEDTNVAFLNGPRKSSGRTHIFTGDEILYIIELRLENRQ